MLCSDEQNTALHDLMLTILENVSIIKNGQFYFIKNQVRQKIWLIFTVIDLISWIFSRNKSQPKPTVIV